MRASSPWSKLRHTTQNLTGELQAIEALLSCNTPEDIRAVEKDWDDSLKRGVWAGLSDQERCKVYSIMYPRAYEEGAWVLVEGTEGSPEKIKSFRYNSAEGCWVYTLVDGREIPEEYLSLDPNYNYEKVDYGTTL
jgi:hypothetical protein